MTSESFPRRGGAGRMLPAAILAAAVLASCWHPAFDPDISGSESVIRKLGSPVLWFSAEGIRGYGMEDGVLFLPTADNPPSSGVVVWRDELMLRYAPASFDAATHWGWVYRDNGFDRINQFGDQYTAFAAPNGYPEVFLACETAIGVYVNPLYPPTTTEVAYPSTAGTLGVGISNIPMTTQARSAWIGFQAAEIPAYMPSGYWTGGSVPGFSGISVLQFSDYASVSAPGKAFFPNLTGYLYLSCGLSDGSRAIYRWTNPSTQEPSRYPEVYGPLAAALSDGRLLAEKNGILTVLDPDLRRLFSFPAGSLHFVHERWDGSATMYSVFTRAVYVRTDSHDDNGRMDVEVYEIPTSDLYKLAD